MTVPLKKIKAYLYLCIKWIEKYNVLRAMIDTHWSDYLSLIRRHAMVGTPSITHGDATYYDENVLKVEK